mmetsp:Transcript_17418/g.17145  ORF Transcript_17418/g.17145 Transcript_17418/m.17145 type:complete len:153 (+) Transcript_17418:299-757(+)
MEEMVEIYDAAHCSLNVRVGNVGAMSLYRDVLGFKVLQEEIDYYADDENAYEMRKYFKPEYEEIDAEQYSGAAKKGKKQADAEKMNVGDEDDAGEEDKQEVAKEETKEQPDQDEVEDKPSEVSESTENTQEAGSAEPTASKKKKKNRKKKRR